MKHWAFLLTCGAFTSIAAVPLSDSHLARVTNSENVVNADGSYYYKYSLDNGVMQAAEGKPKYIDDAKVYTVLGSYEYPGENGRKWVVEYIADETGYHAMISLRGNSEKKQEIMTDMHEMATFLREFHKRYFRRKFLIF